MLAAAAALSSLQALATPLPPGNTVPLRIRPTPQTNSLQFQSRATPQNGCYITAPNMNFGTYNIFSTAALTSTMTFTLSCGNGWNGHGKQTTGSTISITFGTGSSGTYTNRTLSNGTDTLDYNLYADAAHTEVLGDGSNNTFYFAGYAPNSSFSASGTVYGLLPAQQNVSPGTYNDVVMITLTY